MKKSEDEETGSAESEQWCDCVKEQYNDEREEKKKEEELKTKTEKTEQMEIL